MLMLTDGDVSRLLEMPACIDAVEAAFRARGAGMPAASAVTGLELNGGGLHAKLGRLDISRSYAAAKVNANFPHNPRQHRLPTIQGVLILFDGATGRVLAVMDSGVVTALRTAAATAVAAKHLALPDASVAAFIGCGVQARAHLAALLLVRPLRHVRAFDIDSAAAERFAAETRTIGGLSVEIAPDIRTAVDGSTIVITSTPARRPIVKLGDVAPGTFIGAVGADNETKHEIEPDLMAHAAVIVDDLDQCSRLGDLHHALAAGAMERRHVRGSLDQIVSGRTGRLNDAEIVVFDSTGVAIEDVAAAALIYERSQMDSQI